MKNNNKKSKSSATTVSFSEEKKSKSSATVVPIISVAEVKKRACRIIKGKKYQGVERIYQQVAGIDIGSKLIHVAVVTEKDDYEVREFGTLTPDLCAIAEWLKSLNVQYTAMEATGVYWIPLFEILRDNGLNPALVDPKSVKNVPGRKTDILDCQWIHTLYSCGLLRPAFIPPKDGFRAFMRHRGNLVKGRQRALLQINKSLLLMNIKLDVATSELGSVTGMKIIRAIVDGERDPKKLAALRHYTCKKPEHVFVDALTGNFQETHLFTLKQSLETYDYFRKQMDECDSMILKELKTWKTISKDSPPKGKPIHPNYERAKKPDQNQFEFDMRTLLYQKTGVDLTAINSLEELSVATIISEIGGKEGLNAFPMEKLWCSWLAVCSGNKTSGGKSISGKSKKSRNRIKRTLCMAAMSLTKSTCALGAYYRRMAARVGKSKAIKAVAHKLARLIYRLLKHGHAYVEVGQEEYEKKHRERRFRNLQRLAAEFNHDLVARTD